MKALFSVFAYVSMEVLSFVMSALTRILVFVTVFSMVFFMFLTIWFKIKFTKEFHEKTVSVKPSQMLVFDGQPVSIGM